MTRFPTVRSIVAGLLDLVFAPTCLGCGGAVRPDDPARLVCRRCRTRLRPIPAPICERCGAPRLRTGRVQGTDCMQCREWPDALAVARSACLLQPPADRLVHQLKYRGWHALGEPLAGITAAACRLPSDFGDAARLVVPVPTTRERLRQRGYNQAEVLAGAFARRTGRALVPALERTRGTASQTALQPIARGANVAGAFRAAEAWTARVDGECVLLVDDVLTTGATAVECARTLASAGAAAVGIITFVRALELPRVGGTAIDRQTNPEGRGSWRFA